MNKHFLFFVFNMMLSIYGTAQTNFQWTWIHGDSSALTSWGTKGVFSPSNAPVGRTTGVTWVDTSGNFWMLGGTNARNDLWEYNPQINEWRWVSGDSVEEVPAIYGTQGVSAPGNKPGGFEGGVGWTDKENNLWLFGGRGYTANSYGYMRDLWKYNIATNEWTWVKGNAGVWEGGAHGTKGVPSITNYPGARLWASGWTDTSGRMWLFGGTGYGGNSSTGSLNDLWRYDPQTNEWTWMSGADHSYHPGLYGTQGIASPYTQPKARFSNTTWVDSTGDLWLFGGSNYSNDLWKYSLASNEWTWVKGDSIDNSIGAYGSVLTPALTNKPKGRRGSSGWKDEQDNLWLFGGNDWSLKNDMWRYNAPANKFT